MNAKELFLNTFKFNKVERVPVWFMRQAGRYLPGYQKLREKYDFLTLCKTPELAFKISLEPITAIGTDAIIFFCDILTPLEPYGLKLIFNEQGPYFLNPIESEYHFHNLKEFNIEKLTYVEKLIKLLKNELNSKNIPLIGFAGGPFTLARYAIGGKTSLSASILKSMMIKNPTLLHSILDKFTSSTIEYINMQINAGIDYIQLFDTFAGTLDINLFKEFAFPYENKVFKGIKDIKKIIYVKNSNHLLDILTKTNADAISVDNEVKLSQLNVDFKLKVIQGNITPEILYKDEKSIKNEVMNIFKNLNRNTGHIFNLGHGVPKDVEPIKVKLLVEIAKECSREYNKR